MMLLGFKWIVDISLVAGEVELVPYADREGRREIAYPHVVDDYFHWEAKSIEEGVLIPRDRLLKMDTRCAEALRDELIKVFGNPDKPAVQAELDATKYHLEDMRKLVFEGGDRVGEG